MKLSVGQALVVRWSAGVARVRTWLRREQPFEVLPPTEPEPVWSTFSNKAFLELVSYWEGGLRDAGM